MDHSNELNRFIYLFIKILFLHTFFTNSYNIKNKKNSIMLQYVKFIIILNIIGGIIIFTQITRTNINLFLAKKFFCDCFFCTILTNLFN